MSERPPNSKEVRAQRNTVANVNMPNNNIRIKSAVAGGHVLPPTIIAASTSKPITPVNIQSKKRENHFLAPSAIIPTPIRLKSNGSIKISSHTHKGRIHPYISSTTPRVVNLNQISPQKNTINLNTTSLEHFINKRMNGNSTNSMATLVTDGQIDQAIQLIKVEREKASFMKKFPICDLRSIARKLGLQQTGRKGAFIGRIAHYLEYDNNRRRDQVPLYPCPQQQQQQQQQQIQSQVPMLIPTQPNLFDTNNNSNTMISPMNGVTHHYPYHKRQIPSLLLSNTLTMTMEDCNPCVNSKRYQRPNKFFHSGCILEPQDYNYAFDDPLVQQMVHDVGISTLLELQGSAATLDTVSDNNGNTSRLSSSVFGKTQVLHLPYIFSCPKYAR